MTRVKHPFIPGEWLDVPGPGGDQPTLFDGPSAPDEAHPTSTSGNGAAHRSAPGATDQAEPRPAAADPGPDAGSGPWTLTLDSGTGTGTGAEAVLRVTDPALTDVLRPLPGLRWDSRAAMWRVTVHRRTARALRTALRGHPGTVDTAAAAALAAAADTSSVDIDVDPDGRYILTTPHSAALQDAVQRLGGRWDQNRWVIPATAAARILGLAHTHDLLLSDAAVAATTAAAEPFTYDLTLDGLRGVPVTELNVVSGARKTKHGTLTERFAGFGIETVHDLLTLVPRRYLDRATLAPIRDLTVGADAGVVGTVTSAGQWDRVKKLIRFVVNDGTGDLTVTFFRAPWMNGRFKTGDTVVLYGKVTEWTGGHRVVKQMTNPVMDPLDDDTTLIIPVYPQSGKNNVTTWELHNAAKEAVTRIGALHDPVPDDVQTRHDLMPRADALREIHLPTSVARAQQARTRLAFDELLRMQLALLMARRAADAVTGIPHPPPGALTAALRASLPFTLTDGQDKALTDITADLSRPHPMHRLVQGDVGSGKTLVAMAAAVTVIEGGRQVALMAPTEILASQLHREAVDLLTPLTRPDGTPLRVAFLANKVTAKGRRGVLAALAAGDVDLIVGTHALLVPDVEFRDLGLVIIDEQHRFGVEQRATLRAKRVDGMTPDMLVMTATPIPRTAALTTYGDLDVSTITDLPPGRTPIRTVWHRMDPDLTSPLSPPWDEVRAQVDAGRQAYVVTPLVEDSETLQAASAIATFDEVTAGALAGLRIGLVHGKQPAAERDATMASFKAGNLDVVVATTVIEVGVNVPNASVIVILDAGRFGLAQLHQLRGRVGRGVHASTCHLVGQPASADGVERLQALVTHTSGHRLAEIDLTLRGPGALLSGDRQSGVSDLKVADPLADTDLLLLARREAVTLLDGDPSLARRPGLRQEVWSALGPDAVDALTKS